jgi:hypothetical protein
VHRDSRIKRIVALGNTFRLPTLQKYLQQNLQTDVERLDSFHAGQPDDGRLAALLSDNIGSMAGAYGLALQAMGQGKIASSLLPVEIKRAKIWKEKVRWFGTAAAIFVAAAGVKYGTYYFHNAKYEANEGLRRQIDTAVREADGLDGKWAAIESSGEPDKIRIRNVNSLQTYRDTWADIWTDIARSLPAQNGADPAKLKATPRAERQQIFVDSINSTYYPDMAPILTAGDEQFKTLAQPSAGGGGNNIQSLNPGGAGGMYPRGPEMPRFGPSGIPGGPRFTAPLPPILGPSGSMPGMPAMPGGPGGEGGAAAPAGPTDRGYLITLQLTSPNRNAPALVDQMLVKDLLARVSLPNALKDQKNYYVARAMVVAAQQINSDETRKVMLRTSYDQKKAAQEAANQPNGNTAGGVPGYDPAAAFRNRAPMMPRGFGAGRIPDMSGRGRLTRPGGVEDTASLDQADREAFTDPLYPNELVLDDWQLTVVVAVVLDPKAPPADQNAAPGAPAQTAAAAPTEPGTAAPAAAEPTAAPAGGAAAEPRSEAPAAATTDDRRTASAASPR